MAPKPKLTKSQMADIRARKAADPAIPHSAFAEEFGVNESTISRLLAAKEEAPSAPAPTVAPFGKLHPSPLNPRKRFDPAALEELKASVVKEGVLLPLLVRPANQPGNTPLPAATAGDFEIIAGERRWRAVQLLIAENAASSNYALTIRVLDPCDDRKLLELALTENVARKDMTPLEEAEAFAKLVDQGASPSEIGHVVGMTARTVQKRLRLVRDLTPQVRETLAADEISVEFANVLAAYCPKSQQNATVQEIKDGRFSTTANLKRMCLQTRIPEKGALFDIASYTGEWIEDDEAPGVRYFADGGQFSKLQTKALKEKVEDLSKTYCAVEVFDRAKGQSFYKWNYTEKAGHPKARAVIELDERGAATIHLDLVHDSDLRPATAATPSKEPTPAEPTTKAHNAHAHRRKTAALQNAVAAAPMMAVRLAVLALMKQNDATKITPDHIGQGEGTYVVADGPRGILEKEYDRFTAAFPEGMELDGSGLSSSKPWHRPDGVVTWQALVEMPDATVLDFFAALVALRTGAFDGYDPTLGDRPVTVEIAATLGLFGQEAVAGLSLQDGDLEGLRKETLLTVARANGVREANTLKIADLKTAIAETVDPAYVLPSLRFGAEKDIKEMLLKGKPHPGEVSAAMTASSDRQPPQLLDGGPTLNEVRFKAIAGRIAKDPPMTEDAVRTDLAEGINALLGRPLEQPIPDDARFDPEEMATHPVTAISDLFDMAMGDETIADIPTFGAAVAYVCRSLEIPFDAKAAE